MEAICRTYLLTLDLSALNGKGLHNSQGAISELTALAYLYLAIQDMYEYGEDETGDY